MANKKTKPEVPVNPMIEPQFGSGDVNQTSPVTQALQGSWSTYSSSLGQAESEGEIGENGLETAPEYLPDRTHRQGSEAATEDDDTRRKPPPD